MSQAVPILFFEEGFKEKPYIDTEGYPTVAGGIKIGPKGAALKNYTFTVPRAVGEVWTQVFVDNVTRDCRSNPSIYAAMQKCNPARQDILISMAYQMGVAGLAGFKNTLALIAAGKFTEAANGMLSSKWARQTPNRAHRHAEVMRTGTYDIYKGLI
ncbi:lysozyme [Escherichia sp. ESNIH1]|uniref:glycoside hydrolase family protein n=1 Tax=Escherichia sp. ESNIH1 TaxID=1985876 RepID=UPI000CDCE8D1|nr:glycoside hydrolase family protein [Escherichia sp. ESNIH1]POU03613.1 lysozyme [Escherichia sp. ESNIH1]